MFPILDKAAFDDVKSILDCYFADNTNAMELMQNGSWEPVHIAENSNGKEQKYQAQAELYKKYKKLDESKPKNSDTQFEVRRK